MKVTKTRFNKLTAWVLTLAMIMTFIPSFTIGVSAEDTSDATTKNIMLGTDHITGGQASNIYFGNYQQTVEDDYSDETKENIEWRYIEKAKNNGQSGYYSIDPIKWRVLSNANGKVFLLSDKNLDVVRYNESYTDVTWETSTMRSWLNGYRASSNQNAVDYSSDNFINYAFSTSEKEHIVTTNVVNEKNSYYNTSGGNNTTDKIFLLSIAETKNTSYGFMRINGSTDTRKSLNTAYVAGGGHIGTTNMSSVGTGDDWWLRSPGGTSDFAAFVSISGYITELGNYVHSSINAVRPAFNLNLSSVLFTSAASSGKPTGFNAVEDYSGNDYKLTFEDSSRSFSITDTSAKAVKTGDTLSFEFSNAEAGVNEYISAMLVDSNNEVVYYGQLTTVESESGTVTLTVPADIETGTYTLKLFNEQINGDYKTDYASDFEDITLNITETIATYNLWVCGTQVTSKNASDILGNGKVKYDAATTTLTFTDADISIADESKAIVSATEDIETLTIVGVDTTADGSNILTHTGENAAISAVGNLVIKGSFGKISGGKYGIYTDGMLEITTPLEIYGGTAAIAAGGGIGTDKVVVREPAEYAEGSIEIAGKDEGYTTIGTEDGEGNFTAATTVKYDKPIFVIDEDGVLIEYNGPKEGKVVIPDGVTAIGKSVFRDYWNISEVIIPEGVKSIGQEAFADVGITSLVLPDSVETIGASAFYECTNLESVVLGNGVRSIYGHAFMNCEKLLSLTLPATVTYIEDYYAFRNVMELLYLGTHDFSDVGKDVFWFKPDVVYVTSNYTGNTFCGIPVEVIGAEITEISFNTESSAYNSETNTFTVPKDSAFEVYLKGNNFEFVNDTFYENTYFGFVPDVENSENALAASLADFKEKGFTVAVDTDTDTITLSFDYAAIKDFLGSNNKFEGICYGDGNSIKEENIKAVNIVLKKYSSGGGGSSGTTTTTTKNDDGSTTKTTTNKSTGTVTETTTYPDGSSVKVETKKDGTVTTTEKDAEGNTTTTVEKSDGTTVTTEKTADGTTTVITGNADGSATEVVVQKDGTKVTTETTADGESTIEIDVPSNKETEVTVPVENAEDVTSVVVTDKNGNETEITDFEITEDGIKISVSGDCTVAFGFAEKIIFDDVHPVNHWATNDIDYTYINGLMKGTSENLFSPDAPLTRTMLVTVLYRLEGEPRVSGITSFSDLEPGQYYLDAVCWAQVNGIVNGVSETEFAPNDNITREQIAAIMHRYAKFKGYDVSVGENTNILSYDDFAQISEYAIASMQYAVGSGLMKGKSNTTLNPLDNATRAEIAAILHRFIEANK